MIDCSEGVTTINEDNGLRSAGPAKQHSVVEMLRLVEDTLDDDKAQEVVSIDLEGKTAIADYMVVASGRSQRHVSALAERLARCLKEEGYGAAAIEGLPRSDWVLLDAGDIIVHIFRPEVRTFYNLEKMWTVMALPEDVAAL